MKRLFDIRAGELKYSLAGFFVLFGIVSAHTMLETARDALFLASMPATQLPWVYLGIAALALVILRLQRKLPFRSQGDCRLLGSLLLLSAVITLGFWFLLANTTRPVLFAFYIWSGVLTLVVVVHVWALLGDEFSATQAKRVYPFIAAGSVVGGIAGTGIARALVEATDARDLVLVAAGILLTTALIAAPRLHGSGGNSTGDAPVSADEGIWATFRRVTRSPYASRIARLALVATLAATFADYIFKAIVAEMVPADELGAFFSTVYFVTNVASLVVQLVIVQFMLQRVRVSVALAIVPLVVLVGSSVVLSGAAMAGALIIVGGQGALKHSLQRTSMELLYVPLPDSLRLRVKTLIEVVSDRGGKALASIALLAMGLLGAPIGVIAAVGAALALFWVVAAVRFQRHYVDHFRRTLRGDVVDTRNAYPALDVASLGTLLAALNDDEDDRVIAALRILDEEDQADLIPALILYHPSDDVVRAALRILEGAGRSGDIVSIADRILDTGPAPMRCGMLLRARMSARPDRVRLEAFAANDCAISRVTAEVFLAANGWSDPATSLKRFEAIAVGPHESPRLALSEALVAAPADLFLPLLHKLMESADPAVRDNAARAFARRGGPADAHALIGFLGVYSARVQAHDAIVSLREAAIDPLIDTLEHTGNSRSLRREVVRVLGRIGGREASMGLVRALKVEQDGAVRFRIIRELEMLRKWGDAKEIPADAVHAALATLRSNAVQAIENAITLGRGKAASGFVETPFHDLLITVLNGRAANDLELIVRCLGLLGAKFDSERIVHGLLSGNAELVASAREVLESTAPRDYRNLLMGLAPDSVESERIQRLGIRRERLQREYGAVLSELLEADSTTLRSLAARAIGEGNIVELVPRLEALHATSDRSIGDVLSGVIERLRTATREERLRGVAT